MNKFLKVLSIIFILALFALSNGASAQDITTGNASSTTNVENNVNNTNLNLDCDCTPTPTPSTITPTPTTELTPTLTPTPTPGDGNGGKKPLGDGRSSSPSGPTQAVLGLSATGSDNNLFMQFGQLISALFLSVLGFKLFRKNA